MLSNTQSISSSLRPHLDNDPFVSYSQALHDYTLRLWTESRRIAEEKARKRRNETEFSLTSQMPKYSPT
ncbi:hypothetical protein PAXRUDRAFT_825835 [Paxillus rubicundulus Ve08.2h10]|uniref:Uncharacterized protein n=1 Tax=Paxillus rubicundulus Ve08.2h10 TaxID=930991 RepID=A0A0D0EAF4_9AGAM|nr:hypothetical protein PAXRUDRAFT_825835 [Paxillus rubicundulus Ve08.2h10]